MIEDHNSPRLLISSVLHELAADADAVLLIAKSLEDHASSISGGATPQKLRQMASMVKSAALALGMAAASVVGATERLSIVAAFIDVDEEGSGELPS